MTVRQLIALLERVDNKDASVMLVANGKCTHHIQSVDVEGFNRLEEGALVLPLVQHQEPVLDKPW